MTGTPLPNRLGRRSAWRSLLASAAVGLLVLALLATPALVAKKIQIPDDLPEVYKRSMKASRW